MAIKDNEAVYDNEIAPLMQRIIDICKRHEIPMAATFEYAPDLFCSTAIPFDGQAEHMRDANQLLTSGIRNEPLFQITTTKADGSKTIEVIVP
jgi:hypothetical protein